MITLIIEHQFHLKTNTTVWIEQKKQNSHVLQALLVHQTPPNLTTSKLLSVYCYAGACVCCFFGRWHSLPVLWRQQHLCLLWYPDRQQRSLSFTQKSTFSTSSMIVQSYRFGAKCFTLTFSPARPLSPAMPGSVTPGRPCTIHSSVLSQLHLANMNCI